MNWAVASGVVVAVITQLGLLLVALAQRRKTREERESIAVDMLQDVTSELRLEMVRISEDRAATVLRLQAEIDAEHAAAMELRDELRQARQDARGAHETTGRAMRRVDYLERILREHGIIFDPGPLA